MNDHPDSDHATGHPLNGAMVLPDRLKSLLPGIQDAVAARSRSLCGQVVFTAGKVTVIDSMTSSERELHRGDRLSSDMTVRTGARGSRVMLRLDDGSELWLGESAELDLSSWNKSTARTLRLAAGRLLAFVAKAQNRFVTQLQAGAVVEVLGTSFDLEIDESGAHLDVITGEVVLRNLKGETQGRAGTRLAYEFGASPTKATGAKTSSYLWIRETLKLGGSSDLSLVAGPAVRTTYKPLMRPVAFEAICGFAGRHKTSIQTLCVLLALVITCLYGYREGIFGTAPAFSTEEVRAAILQVEAEQIKELGAEAATIQHAEKDLGFIQRSPSGELRRVPIDESVLTNLELSSLPEDFKRKVLDTAARTRERRPVVAGDSINIDGTSIYIGGDSRATGDLVRWLTAQGVPEESAKQRAAEGLVHSIKSQFPPGIREDQQIIIQYSHGDQYGDK